MWCVVVCGGVVVAGVGGQSIRRPLTLGDEHRGVGAAIGLRGTDARLGDLEELVVGSQRLANLVPERRRLVITLDRKHQAAWALYTKC